MEIEEKAMDCLNITFEDSLDLEERFEDNIHLVGRLIVDNEPSQYVVNEVLISAWNKMGVVRVQKAKPNVYAITVGEAAVARQILEGNPWIIRDYTFSVKLWSTYHFLDDIEVDRAVFWIQAHGMPRNLCSIKNARCLGEKIRAVVEVEDPVEGSYKINLKYKGLRMFCYRCGKLGHARGCPHPATLLANKESKYNESLKVETLTSYLIGSDRVKEYPPTTSLKVSSDYGHLWHPDSYGTQFTNDTLTITVNGLSLNKDWYDPSKIPP
ncbi:unnamed protein product [Malus baccata var. baccata]